MTNFAQEDRYLVLKRSDIDKYITDPMDLLELEVMTEKIANGRMDDGRSRGMPCAVVEKDWPNYEHVWETVRQVAEGSFNPNMVDDAISQGVCLALQHVTDMGEQTLWKAIVTSADVGKLIDYVRNNPEEYILAGFDQFAASELGHDVDEELLKAVEESDDD